MAAVYRNDGEIEIVETLYAVGVAITLVGPGSGRALAKRKASFAQICSNLFAKQFRDELAGFSGVAARFFPRGACVHDFIGLRVNIGLRLGLQKIINFAPQLPMKRDLVSLLGGLISDDGFASD